MARSLRKIQGIASVRGLGHVSPPPGGEGAKKDVKPGSGVPQKKKGSKDKDAAHDKRAAFQQKALAMAGRRGVSRSLRKIRGIASVRGLGHVD